MSISSTSLLLAAALAGCTGLFALDAAVLDTDLDGVADAVDNCPLDENSQQRDSDGNGLGDVCDCATTGADLDADGVDDACDDCVGEPTGADAGGDGIDDGCEVCAAATGLDQDGDGLDDACDACVLGPPHDEDGDGVDDACDGCPAQATADPPGMAPGPACDRGGPRTALFDPLVEQEAALWPGNVPGWTWSGDQLIVDRTTSRALRLSPTQAVVMETRATTEASVALTCDSGDGGATCSLDATRSLTLVRVQFGFGTDRAGPLPGTGPVRFQLRNDLAGGEVTCEALDEAGAVIAVAHLPAVGSCSRLKVGATGPARLDYLWLVTD